MPLDPEHPDRFKILQVHNRYINLGGEDTAFDSTIGLLRKNGHEIVEYIQENRDFIPNHSSWKVGLRALWSNQDYQRLRDLMRDKHPDVMHMHNFFPLISPAAYYAGKAEGVPVVQTLHNYRLLCSNALFFRAGKICEDCLGKTIPWPGVMHACYRGSRPASGAVASMLAIHKLMGTWTKKIDVYIALTEFARRKFIEGGLPASKIMVLPNFINVDPAVGSGKGGYGLYVGHLSNEKGLDNLFEAWKSLKQRTRLKIVGDGPLVNWVAQKSTNNPYIEFLRHKPLDEVYSIMGEAIFIAIPSKLYEGMPRTAIEAFGTGTPIIASNNATMSNLITHTENGLLYRSGDVQDLAAKIEWVLDHPAEMRQMRHEARSTFEKHYSGHRNYPMLMSIYETAISRSQSNLA